MLMVLKKYLTSQPDRRDRLWLCQYSGMSSPPVHQYADGLGQFFFTFLGDPGDRRNIWLSMKTLLKERQCQ
jgi:hypothetical protein